MQRRKRLAVKRMRYYELISPELMRDETTLEVAKGQARHNALVAFKRDHPQYEVVSTETTAGWLSPDFGTNAPHIVVKVKGRRRA